MNLLTGDMWAELDKADLILVTTNSTLNRRGDLVMGRGAALQAALRWPNLAHTLAQQAQYRGTPEPAGLFYGVLPGVLVTARTHVGAFQTKYHWRDGSTLNLIRRSAQVLATLAPEYRRIVLNYPGIGAGGLTHTRVAPLLAGLPDNVYVYQRSQPARGGIPAVPTA